LVAPHRSPSQTHNPGDNPKGKIEEATVTTQSHETSKWGTLSSSPEEGEST
jgi:hypothetical protein